MEKKSDRKIGQPKPDLSTETTAEILKKAKSLIRTDWGGKDPMSVIAKMFEKEGVAIGPKSAAIVKRIAEDQVEGCRRRTDRRMNEAIKRCELVPDLHSFDEVLP